MAFAFIPVHICRVYQDFEAYILCTVSCITSPSSIVQLYMPRSFIGGWKGGEVQLIAKENEKKWSLVIIENKNKCSDGSVDVCLPFR